jgi:hypothetical protein
MPESLDLKKYDKERGKTPQDPKLGIPFFQI